MRVGELKTIEWEHRLITIERTATGYRAWFYNEPLHKVTADTYLGVIGRLFLTYPKGGVNDQD